jgi:hypothetical protein
MKIAIVILNYNGVELLKRFLPVLINCSEGQDIYVIDNASSDKSLDLLSDQFPSIKQIKLDSNYGYAGGYNKGLSQIDASHYCLLNSDVEVSPNWLQPIIETFTKNERTAIIQPKIRAIRQTGYFEYAGASGGYIDAYGYAFCRGRIFDNCEIDQGQYNDSVDIDWAGGACFFIKASSFEDLGGFDSDYFAHYEEIDLCWRAKNKGMGIKVVPSSVVFHLGGATLSHENPFKTYLNYRNSLFTLYKNLPNRNLIPRLFLRMLLDGISGLRFLLKGQFKAFLAIIKAHISFYLAMPKLHKKRLENPNRKTKYFREKSIVWSYFVKGINRYSSL